MERHRVKNVFEYGDSQYKLIINKYNNIDSIKGSVCIEGIASHTLSSMLATGFIADELKLPLVGHVDSPSIPGKCLIEHGVPCYPIRILGNKHIVIFQCEFKIVSAELNYYLAHAIIEFVRRHECKLLFTMEGMPTNPADMKDEDDLKKIRYLTTDLSLSKWLKERDHMPIQSAIIPGFTGLLLNQVSLQEDINIAALLVKSNRLIPDSKASVILVRMLDDYLTELPLKTNELEKKSKELEKQVNAVLKKASEQNEHPASMYM